MILQPLEQSPNQKAAIEELVGRDLHNQPKNPTRNKVQKIPSVLDHQAAVDQMRYQLYLLDRSQRRPSIEDYIENYLEKSGTEASR
jgi:hypothetical protein